MGGVSFHPGGNRALVEVKLQPKGYAAFFIYTLFDRTSAAAPSGTGARQACSNAWFSRTDAMG
jgi:hypothetical protein